MDISTPTKRLKLKIRREPFWHKLQVSGYVGFRRTVDGGTWVARWRDDKNKQHYRALNLAPADPQRAFDEASTAARKWFKDMQAGVVARWTVADAAARYVEKLAVDNDNGEDAAADARARIKKHIAPSMGHKYLDTITTGDIDAWLRGLVPKGLDEEERRKKKTTANRNLTTFKALLNHAWRIGKVGSDSAWRKALAFKNVGIARKIFLNGRQRKTLLEKCDGSFRDLVEAGLLTGARYGEFRQLKVSCYDKARRQLSILKGKTRERDVPLSDAANRLFGRLSKGKLPDEFMLTRDDGLAWQHSDQDGLMRAAVKSAKLPRKTVFYSLRHTFIANAIEGGIDLVSIGKMAGTSVRMIELHYAKLLRGKAQSKLNRIDFV